MISNIKSTYILKKVFENVEKFRYFKILQRNKAIRNKLNLSLDTYKKYYNQIEIELITKENIEKEKNIFINDAKIVFDYEVYFNSGLKEIQKRNYFNKNEKITRIRILIDIKGETISLSSLFENVQCIKEAKIIHCAQTKVNDISDLFFNCKSLISADLSKLKVDNITTMARTFGMCSSLINDTDSSFITLPSISI